LAALLPTWKQEFDWLSDVPAQALQQSLKDLDQAYINFFKKRANSPVFRKKSKRDSFRIPQGFEVDSANGRVKLPKLGWIRYRNSRDIEGKPKNITVTLGNGRAFISIQTERDVEQPLHPSTSVVGLGRETLLHPFGWHLRRWSCSLERVSAEAEAVTALQRRLSRKRRFSKNWQKAKARVAKIHTKS
jgi:putative transposase